MQCEIFWNVIFSECHKHLVIHKVLWISPKYLTSLESIHTHFLLHFAIIQWFIKFIWISVKCLAHTLFFNTSQTLWDAPSNIRSSELMHEDTVHINAGMLCSSRTFLASSSASASEGHQSHKHIHTWHHTLTHPYAQYCMGMKVCVFKQKRMVKWAGEEAGQSLCIRKVTFKTHGLEGPINQPAHTAALRTAWFNTCAQTFLVRPGILYYPPLLTIAAAQIEFTFERAAVTLSLFLVCYLSPFLFSSLPYGHSSGSGQICEGRRGDGHIQDIDRLKAECDCVHACVVGGLELLLPFGMFCELLFSLWYWEEKISLHWHS